jgi:single-strand DNA-binding protein
MKNGLNLTQIIGNLGRAPELKTTASGQAVASFSVAVNHTYRDTAGQVKEETEWFSVIAWGKLAAVIAQYAEKGSRVYVQGRMKTRSWEQDGSKHYRTELVAGEVRLLDGRRADAADAEVADDGTGDGYDDLPF